MAIARRVTSTDGARVALLARLERGDDGDVHAERRVAEHELERDVLLGGSRSQGDVMPRSAVWEFEIRRGRAKIGCDGCKTDVLAVHEVRVDRKKVIMLCRSCASRPLTELAAAYAGQV